MKVSPGRQQVDEILLHLAEHRTEARLPTSRTFSIGASTMVPMFMRRLARDAFGADMHAALAVAEQLAPAFVGGAARSRRLRRSRSTSSNEGARQGRRTGVRQ